MEVPRRWLRVKRNDAFGELPWRVATRRQTVEVATCRQTVEVATCRQTVEALLAPLSTAWQRMATARSRWLGFAADV
jgi:hypothetical protein